MKLTDRQKTILEKIHGFIERNAYPPTARDIAEIMGFSSPKAATDHFKSLEKKGYIEKNSLARSIRLTKKAFVALGQDKNPAGNTTSGSKPASYLPPWITGSSAPYNGVSYLPLLGRIAAGNPILAEENIDEYLPIPESFSGAYGADFALRVRGDSMTGDHILDGDMIMVKAQSTAENGEIVVALIDDEAAVKRFYRTKNGIELRSSNPGYPPIIISGGKSLNSAAGDGKAGSGVKNPGGARVQGEQEGSGEETAGTGRTTGKSAGAGSFRIIGKVVAVHRSIHRNI